MRVFARVATMPGHGTILAGFICTRQKAAVPDPWTPRKPEGFVQGSTLRVAAKPPLDLGDSAPAYGSCTRLWTALLVVDGTLARVPPWHRHGFQPADSAPGERSEVKVIGALLCI